MRLAYSSLMLGGPTKGLNYELEPYYEFFLALMENEHWLSNSPISFAPLRIPCGLI